MELIMYLEIPSIESTIQNFPARCLLVIESCDVEVSRALLAAIRGRES